MPDVTAQAASNEPHARRGSASGPSPTDPASGAAHPEVPAGRGEAAAGNHLRVLADRQAWAVETQHALDRLEPDYQRIVLVASYFDGHSQVEIADGLQLPETTVAATMARAMQQLAALLLSDNRATR